MTPRFHSLCLAVLVQFLASFAGAAPLRLDPTQAMTQYVISSWRDTSGLPADSVTAVAQTPDGYLWLGTEHGLARFDGVRFTLFSSANTSAFRSDEIYALFTARDGTLWIGTRGGGAVTYRDAHFVRVPVKYRFIVGFAQSGDGAVWMGAPGGVAREHKGIYRTFGKDEGYEGGSLVSVAADHDGVYLALPSGVLRIGEHGTQRWTEADGLSGGAVTSLTWSSRGLLAGNESGGIDRLVDGRFENILRTAQRNRITWIHEGAGGSLWLATSGGGLLRWFDGKIAQLTERDGLKSDSLNQVVEDSEGNLWLPGTGGGVVRLKQGRVSTLVTRQPLIGEWVLPLVEASDGSVWFTTNGGGLHHLVGRDVTRLTVADGLVSNSIIAIDAAEDGSIWIASESAVQRIARGAVAQTFALGREIEGQRVFALCVARNGVIWVSTNGGVHQIERGAVRRLTEKDGIGPGAIISIHEAADGSFWFGKPGSVEHMVGRKVTSFDLEDGLHAKRFYSMTLDEKDGSVWIATAGDGLARIINGRVRTYRASHGLLSDSIYGVVHDRAGNLWITASRGLFTIKRTAFEQFDAGKIDSVPITVYGKSDGLKTNDFSGGFDRPGFRAVDGTLWFPTTRGLVVVDTTKLQASPEVPRVAIEGIEVNGNVFPPSGALVDTRPAERRFEISYTAPSHYAPESTTFRFMLEGLDEEWRDAGSRRTAYYTNVPAGQYRFRVQAMNGAGMSAESSAPIEVIPRFYERAAFKVAIALLIGLIALVVHRRRVDALHAHQEALRSSEEHFRSLIENASDMILVVDSSGELTYASPSVHRALAFPEEGRGLISTEACSAFLAEVRAKGRHSTTLRMADHACTPRFFESIGAALDDGRVVLNCRDITDRRKLESQLEQSNRLASLGRLAATVSHEFNNVLMGIQPHVDILRRRPEAGLQNITVRMSEAIQRGKRISEQILRYTRPVEPALAPVALHHWLRDLEVELSGLLGGSIRLAIAAPEGLSVQADAGQLAQVMTNLAINARDAGATMLEIESGVVEGDGVFPFGVIRDPERFAHIRVRDNGSGIHESVLPNIFEPLFTTKMTKGTGLGLAVVQQVVARHGGEVFAESRIGSGTTFHFFLPIAVSESGELLRGEEPAARSSLSGCRILLVEDDPAVAEGIGMLLEGEGFDVEVATTGANALVAMARFAPTVVVLDVGLPDIDGVEVYRRMMKKWPSTSVIFSTGHSDIAELADVDPQPQCLLKPYTVETLLAAISQVTAAERSVA